MHNEIYQSNFEKTPKESNGTAGELNERLFNFLYKYFVTELREKISSN